MKLVIEINSNGQHSIHEIGDHLNDMHRQLDIWKTAYRDLQKEYDELVMNKEEEALGEQPSTKTEWKEMPVETDKNEGKICMCGAKCRYVVPIELDSERALQERGGWRPRQAVQSDFTPGISAVEGSSTSWDGRPV